MDTIDDKAIQQILFNEGLDLDQLENFFTESGSNLGLSDLPGDGSIGGQQGGGVQLQPFKLQGTPGGVANNGIAPSAFSNLAFETEDVLLNGGNVPLSHMPDSPPDSGSEPYSPPDTKFNQQIAALQQSLRGISPPQPPITTMNHNSINQSHVPLPNRTVLQDPGHQRQHSLPTSIAMSTVAAPPPVSIPQPVMTVPTQPGQPQSTVTLPSIVNMVQQQQTMVPNSHAQVQGTVGVSSISATMPPQSVPQQTVPQQFMDFLANAQNRGTPPTSLSQVPMTETINTSLTREDSYVSRPTKKRKHSISPNSTLNQNMLNSALMQVKQEPVDPSPCPIGGNDGEYNVNSNISGDYNLYDQPSGDGLPYTDTVYQFLKWQPYQANKWHTVLDVSGQEIQTLNYRVEADKGFNFSMADDAFVCQKKNHFQVTVHLCSGSQPYFVQTEAGMKEIDDLFIHIHGIKVEALNSYIRVEQSQADRSKKPFQPAKIDVHPDNVVKATIGRLHFNETTSNNMRKKGKPNPDQRYFMLVVSLQAHCGKDKFIVASNVSERIIVRASNPGQFENDVDAIWQKGSNPDAIYHGGRVGINTERPDEALVVNGNIKVTGHVMQPSDKRAKEDFQEVNSKEQLKNIGKLRIMRYRYIPQFKEQAGLPECDQVETGVIAQEVMEILPDAVEKTGDVNLSNGTKIDSFLVVNKDRIYMENVGAVKELVRLTDNLETRIDELEKMNQKLAKLKRVDSLKSNTSIGTLSRNGSKKSGGPGKNKGPGRGQCQGQSGVHPCLSPRSMQLLIVALILIMLFCFAAIATLYILDSNGTPSGLSTLMPPTGGTQSGPLPPSTISTLVAGISPKTSTPLPPIIPKTTPCSENCAFYCCDVAPSNTPLPAVVVNNPALNQTYRASAAPSLVMFPTTPTAESMPADQDPSSVISQASIPGGDVRGGNGSAVIDPITTQTKRKRSLRNIRATENAVAVVSTILVDRTNVLCGSACSKECGPSTDAWDCSINAPGNFSYNVDVGAHFPHQFADLYLNTSTTSIMTLCYWTEDALCSGNDFGDMPSSVANQPVSVNSAHTWQLPVGIFQNSSYVFRVLSNIEEPQTNSFYCSMDPSELNSVFLEYEFHFKRDVSVCP